jgi:uncharacterized membrane protein YphA (DoxX/SURF4 family)
VSDIAAASAGVLAVVFAWAGIAKLRTPIATAASFQGLGLPAPTALARIVPAVELVVAVGLIAAPAVAAWVALALLLAFTFVIGRAIVAGSTVSCACFGSAASSGGDEDDRPVSVVELVRNAGLGALAIVAGGAGSGALRLPALPAIVIVTVLVALARVAFAAVELRRLGGHLWSTPLPGNDLS